MSKILLVEDNPDAVKRIIRYINKIFAELDVVSFPEAGDALQYAKANDISLFILDIQLPFLFSEKMDWGRFDCSHSDGCSNWGNSSVWHWITFRQRMEPCCRYNGSRVVFRSGTAFCQSLAGVCLLYPLSAYWKLADIWNLYVDWAFH